MLAAFTELYSVFFLGARTLGSFREFGILPAFKGVVVSDRYQNYFHDGWEHIAGHQACCAHLVRDFEDTAESWPDAIWPGQAQRALRGLIRVWHAAREQSQPEIPPHIRDPLIKEFRALSSGQRSIRMLGADFSWLDARDAAGCGSGVQDRWPYQFPEAAGVLRLLGYEIPTLAESWLQGLGVERPEGPLDPGEGLVGGDDLASRQGLAGYRAPTARRLAVAGKRGAG